MYSAFSAQGTHIIFCGHFLFKNKHSIINLYFKVLWRKRDITLDWNASNFSFPAHILCGSERRVTKPRETDIVLSNVSMALHAVITHCTMNMLDTTVWNQAELHKTENKVRISEEMNWKDFRSTDGMGYSEKLVEKLYKF